MTVVTIPDVELVRAGNWASALSGRVQITTDDLDAMVAAGQDAEVDMAPLKLGHVDPRFDGEPAMGWVRNVRRVGDRLLADLTDVPAKLAATVQHAYPRRSVEIAWGVKTPGGRRHRAALCGLALLGVTPPAIKGLADIVSYYSGASSAAFVASVEFTSFSGAQQMTVPVAELDRFHRQIADGAIARAELDRQVAARSALSAATDVAWEAFRQSLRDVGFR